MIKLTPTVPVTYLRKNADPAFGVSIPTDVVLDLLSGGRYVNENSLQGLFDVYRAMAGKKRFVSENLITIAADCTDMLKRHGKLKKVAQSADEFFKTAKNPDEINQWAALQMERLKGRKTLNIKPLPGAYNKANSLPNVLTADANMMKLAELGNSIITGKATETTFKELAQVLKDLSASKKQLAC